MSCDSDSGAKLERKSVRTSCHLFHGSFHASGSTEAVLAKSINSTKRGLFEQRQTTLGSMCPGIDEDCFKSEVL